MKQSGVLVGCGDGTEGSGVGAHGEQVREDVVEVVVELVGPPGEARSLGPGECDMTSAAATAVAKPVVEVRPSGIAKNSVPTESVCTVSPGEAGFSGSSVGGTTQPKWQQSQSWLLKLGLLELRRTVPRQNQHAQCCLVKLDFLGPERVAGIAPAPQES